MKLLWLKSELLHPVDKGGRIRTYQTLRHLLRQHDVTYIALADPVRSRQSLKLADEYCNRVITVPWQETRKFSGRFYRDLLRNLGSPLPYAIEKYRSRQMMGEIERELLRTRYDAMVCDFLVPSVNMPARPRTATVLFQHNVESMIWWRHYENENNPVKKAYFHRQWEKMLAYEAETCRKFDAVAAVSSVDRDFIRDRYGVAEVYDVPTGVDTEYFQPIGGRSDKFELVFTGSMDWMPNEDAMLYFVREILPLIAGAIPDVTLTIVGRSPGETLRSLARSNARVRITGRVEDVRPYVDRAAAYIVPLRVGGGTRLKIYEAMAMGKAVVSTSIGAEGLPVTDGKELIIADGAEEFARAVIRTLTDRALADGLAKRAREVVAEQFGWGRAAAAFAEICENAANRQSRVRAA